MQDAPLGSLVAAAISPVWRAAWRCAPGAWAEKRLELASWGHRLLGLSHPVVDGGPVARPPLSYAEWIARHDSPTRAARIRARMRLKTGRNWPLISVLMPCYNSNPEHLAAAIRSVAGQTYPHWELCIVDDASTDPGVCLLLERHARAEPRIRWLRRARNGHIAHATNTALGLARGAWAVLMDHDDLLAEQALDEVACAVLAHPDAAAIYSDEDKIDADGRRWGPYFKPDFDPHLLLGQNLMSHLGAFRRDLLMHLGGLREGFPGSQDHDLALRVAEAVGPARIHHIPRVLYHWRHDGGPSFSRTQDLLCRASSRRAVEEHLRRQGTEGSDIVEAPLAPPHHRIVWPLPDPAPLASIVLFGHGPTRIPARLASLTGYPAWRLEGGDACPSPSALAERIARAAGDVVVLLRADATPLHRGWLTELAALALRPQVGAAGGKLLTARGDTVLHAGFVCDGSAPPRPLMTGVPRMSAGYFGNLALLRETSAVSGAMLTFGLNRAGFAGGCLV